MKIIAHGHSSIELRGREYRILIDPFFTEKDQMQGLKGIDFILLSHAHADHITGALEVAKQNGAKVIAIYELAAYMENLGAEVEALGIGGTLDLGETKITMVPAVHSSSIFHKEPFSIEYMGQAVGFIVEMDGKRVYHAGDTAIFSDMKLWANLYPLDAAILPIGGVYTMDMRQAVMAADLLNVDHVVPIHYNTFPAIEIEPQDFQDLLQDSGRKGWFLAPKEAFVL
ncbi:metal-dependent hydrolase [Gottschalkiaceae bacterium SANA]|nr:metal-dependent hydrolase [Gottschalkiaceae bacterium SANA]